MWDPTLDKVGTVMAVLMVLVIIWATQVGPMASASVMETWGRWQWTFHVSSLLLILCVTAAFAMPETYAPELQRRRAKHRGLPVKSEKSTWKSTYEAVCRPLHMLMVEPVIFPTGLVVSITQSVVFSYYVAYAFLFESVYGFTQWQVGMSFAPLVVGSFFSIPVVGLCDKLLYQKARQEAREKGLTIAPEKRLYPAMISSITMPISLYW
ncbi:hypothetical protein K3495_g5279 [Podosphaera aphanis]|nr:hypothetical protein K3495_g5279 [Podosphaera aphanis]